MISKIKISVVLSAYNGENHIQEAIQSILNQTLQNFELIIIDDGSTDETLHQIETFKDDRIILKSIYHVGLTKALNQGLCLARGDYIARMDADDIALPNRFEKQVSYLDQHSRVVCVGTAYEVLLANGNRIKPRVPILTSSYKIKKALPKFNPFMHGSMMIRREGLERIGFYNEKFRLSQDYDLWFRMAQEYEMANLNEVLMIRREGKQTFLKEKRQNWFAIQARLKAIQEGNSSSWNLIYMIRPFFVMVTPNWLKRIIRQIGFR